MNNLDGATVDRLTERRNNLAAHMADLERQMVDVGCKIAALDETLRRRRLQKAAATTKRK